MSRFGHRTSCHTCRQMWRERVRRLTGLFKAAERSREVGAEDIGQITALLNENGRKAQSGDRRTNAPEARRRYREAGERIVLRGIETERHHKRTGRKRADGFFRLADCLYIVVIPGALRQWNVQIGAETGPGAALMRVSPHIGIEEDGIGVDRN